VACAVAFAKPKQQCARIALRDWSRAKAPLWLWGEHVSEAIGSATQ